MGRRSVPGGPPGSAFRAGQPGSWACPGTTDHAREAAAMTFPRALAWCLRGAVNTMTLHLAGHAAFADLEHVGRKSGIVRHTPVRAFRAGDTVIIGLNFGRQSDWYQNIKAVGTCRIRLGGEQLTLGAP